MPAENTGVKLLAAIVLAAASGTGLATVHYGQPPPDFAVASAKGRTTLSQLRGKPVVINFWASWCPPCTDELASFIRLQRMYGNRVAIVTVSNEAPGVARAYLQHKRYDLSLVEDPQGAIFRKYSIPPIPDTIVLDASGAVTYVSVGGLSWDELQTAVGRVSGSP